MTEASKLYLRVTTAFSELLNLLLKLGHSSLQSLDHNFIIQLFISPKETKCDMLRLRGYASAVC